jgi:16S rRNA (uracil1498-N3)-methyltransferase
VDPGATSKAHALVADVAAPVLAERDRHHLERVLRLRAGEELTVTDGHGGWRACRFGAELEPIGAVALEEAPVPPIAIGFALVKGARPELVVQKLTELGVDRIVPFVADRSVVQWDDEKASRQHERLTTVAREALMQSRRVWLPTIAELTSFDDLHVGNLAIADRDGEPPSLAHPFVLIGPEGGWSDRERKASATRIRLSANVLRAETAAISAATVLCGMRSGLFTSGTAVRG